MDLHKQWETTESNWIKERMELLDQFDNERKEWESQWKVMQKKIEELCQEVKLRRESKKNSCLKTVEQDKNVQSKMAPFLPHSPIPGQDDTAMLSDGLCPVSLNTDTMEGGSFLEGKNQMGKEQITMRKSKAVFMDPLSTKNQKKYEGGSCLKISEEERKSCTNALNTALEELAKVSEELCNFQEEIRKRSNHRRMKSTPFLQETISTVNPDVNHMISNDSPTALISLDTEKQINKKNLSHVDDMPHDTPVENSVPDTLSLQSNETPPIPPPRSTSRNFPSSYAEDHPVFDSLKENLDSRWETQDCREVGCNFEKISKNEKLAAKTDEFNRTVFRTDRCCSSAQHIQRLLDSSKDSKPCDPLCKCAVHAKESDDLCCIQNNSLSVPKEGKSNSFTKKVMGGQVKQAQEHFDASNYHHMLHEHDWKPSNLLGRPRSADPKSNYGVVEKLLKNYEKSTGSLSQNLKSCQDHWTKLDCNVIKSDKDPINQCLEMFQPEQEKQELQMKSGMSMEQQNKQEVERKELTEESVAMKSTDGKGFSRPARPTNRRPPSRWALRSPSAPPALKKTAYGYSFSLHSETAAV
ncbi:uncharacterized protein KIAA0408 homolog [Vombatus ursinus]|uniref:uncharacterized protein KIAA0408 homolog n=1 Tax=Vombatus ursinus TaxID=29139 RepID=UPI000FFD8C81|nr:uncharacterized protein KIAA0408 homolog [Vombatus ursinus]